MALEILTQVSKAIDWGISVSHVDTHMGTVAHPKFIAAYIQAGVQNRVPVMVPRGNASIYHTMGLDSDTAATFATFTAQLEEQGLPLVDSIMAMPLDHPEDQVLIAKKFLADLKPGLTHFILHPSVDTPELRSICTDWRSRVANYLTFMSPEIKDFIKNKSIHVIGYHDIKNLIN